MGEVQLWQADGLGTDKETLEKVLHIFRSDGIQGMKSWQALESYIKKLDDSSLWEMYKMDEEATLQILVDCFGAVTAAKRYSKWHEEILKTAIDVLQKEKETAEQDAEANRAALLKIRDESRKEIERLEREYSIINYEKEEAEEQIKELKDELAHCKADLYDFYAAADKLQNYERRQGKNE